MKVGILTFHCAYNFGAQLQTYALQEYMRSLGISVSIIDYRPYYLWHPQNYLKQGIKWILSPIYGNNKYFIHNIKFKFFENKYFNLMSLNSGSDYDAIVIGSDQVWNKVYNGKDKIWYGDIKQYFPNSKILSYGLSAGDCTNQNIEKEDIINTYKNFSKILVREEQLLRKLSSWDIKATKVLDPVLMVPNQIWSKFISNKKRKKQIIVYQGRMSEAVFKIAKNISCKEQLKIITTDYYPNSFHTDYKHMELSPKSFIKKVSQSKYIITTSFHGVAVAIITKTQFLYIRLNDNADGRIENILSQLDLEDRMISDIDQFPTELIDYSKVYSKLNSLQKSSQEELQSVLMLET